MISPEGAVVPFAINGVQFYAPETEGIAEQPLQQPDSSEQAKSTEADVSTQILHEDILTNKAFLGKFNFSELKKIQTVSKSINAFSKQTMLERVFSEDIKNIPKPFNPTLNVQFIKNCFKYQFPVFTNYTLKDLYKMYKSTRRHDAAFEIVKLLPKEDFIDKLVNGHEKKDNDNFFDFTHFRFDTLDSITKHFGNQLNKIKNFYTIKHPRNAKEEIEFLKLLENIEAYTTDMSVDENLVHLKGLKNLRNLTFHWYQPTITYKGLEYLCKEITQITSLSLIKSKDNPIPKDWLIPLAKAKHLESLVISSNNCLISDVDIVSFSYSLKESKLKNFILSDCQIKEIDTIMTLFNNSNINNLEIRCPVIKNLVDQNGKIFDYIKNAFKLKGISIDDSEFDLYDTLAFKRLDIDYVA